MNFNEKFLNELLELLEDHKLNFDALKQLVQIRDEKLPEIEEQISQIRTSMPLVQGLEWINDTQFTLTGYDPVLHKVIVTQADHYSLHKLVAIEKFIFGPLSFGPGTNETAAQVH